jgi:hypothetical protein
MNVIITIMYTTLQLGFEFKKRYANVEDPQASEAALEMFKRLGQNILRARYDEDDSK